MVMHVTSPAALLELIPQLFEGLISQVVEFEQVQGGIPKAVAGWYVSHRQVPESIIKGLLFYAAPDKLDDALLPLLPLLLCLGQMD